MTEPSSVPRRRVVRGASEVTEWPRGLVDYRPLGPAEETPSEEEDRTRQRLKLAARLVGLLRAGGEEVDDEVHALAEADRSFRRGEADRARELVEGVLARLDARAGRRSALRRPATP